MKIIVFEGNTSQTCQRVMRYGGIPYHQLFRDVIQGFDDRISVDFAYPADEGYVQLSAQDLQQYDGAFWTGSALNPYDDIPAVTQQIEQSKQVFQSGIPYYGSCWGLQVAVVASGGKTSPCKQGLEVGVAKNIQLTEAGKNHPLVSTRENGFLAFCLHYAEVSQLPEQSTVLAYNDHSQVQAIEIKHAGGTFFGVQYHPEFDVDTMKAGYRRNHEKFLEIGVYQNVADSDDYVDDMLKQYPHDAFTAPVHPQEIYNFLNYIKQS